MLIIQSNGLRWSRTKCSVHSYPPASGTKSRRIVIQNLFSLLSQVLESFYDDVSSFISSASYFTKLSVAFFPLWATWWRCQQLYFFCELFYEVVSRFLSSMSYLMTLSAAFFLLRAILRSCQQLSFFCELFYEAVSSFLSSVSYFTKLSVAFFPLWAILRSCQ
jgi:hypothetical protein